MKMIPNSFLVRFTRRATLPVAWQATRTGQADLGTSWLRCMLMIDFSTHGIPTDAHGGEEKILRRAIRPAGGDPHKCLLRAQIGT
jgi:hypothetical protein